MVSRVSPGSSAEKAGVHEGDVIISLNEKAIKNASTLRNTVGLLPIGQKIELEIIRDGRKKSISAVIGEPQAKKQNAETLHKRLKGAVLGELTENHPLFGKVGGIVILEVNPNTAAWSSGLRKGDVITSVNRMHIKNLKDFKKALKRSNNGILLNIRRGNGALFLLLQ